jgi:porin
MQAPLAVPSVQAITRTLDQQGVTFEGRYLGEFAANPAGGQRQGADYSGELAFGSHLDLAKLIGLEGGGFNILFTQRGGNNLSARYINNSVLVQEIYGGGQTIQLTDFTYHQILFGDKMNVLMGRTELAGEFAHSELYCQFQDGAICGQPFSMAADTSVSIWPVAGWGGRIEIDPTPSSYVKFGIYQDVPEIDPTDSHGFTWGLAGATGFAVPVEIGLKATPPDAAFPDRLAAGVILDRSHFSPSFGSSDKFYGRSLPYVLAQARLWQAEPKSPRGLYGFAVGSLGQPVTQVPLNFEINAALVDMGPFPARPADSLNFSFSENHFSSAALAATYHTRLSMGSEAAPAANLIMFELNYNIIATPWLEIMPNFQYILHPDGNGGQLPFRRTNIPNAVVVGLQFSVDLPTALGIPRHEI